MAPDQVQRGSAVLSARHVTQGSPCNALPLGTEILTLDGALPVEFLCPGDRVITRDSGAVRLIAATRLFGRQHMVRIAPGALGHQRPDQALCLPASQEILLRDWRASALFGARQALVPLSRLVDGHFICDAVEADQSLIALSFAAPHILYADGLELASAEPVTATA
ncbi:Hint domain-containing protein [Mameliella alba]|nr:Hint domain-containing protein [Mameliella alba]MBY6171690.1 Hint domain-containing protein [Mameliella alba]MBY6176915.1 Hint domain-containing protein [Mameliella alba]